MSDNLNNQIKISFTGHDTFPMRHGWLEKSYYAVEKNKENPFSTDDSIIELGVGKNMVNAIRHWALSSNFIVRTANGYEHSDYAAQLLGNGIDPFLENIGSLWKVHYELCKKQSCTTIHWLFSLLNTPSFSKEYLELKLKEFSAENGKPLNNTKSLKSDINVILAMYCGPDKAKGFKEEDISSPLAELNLISRAEDKSYVINTGVKSTLPQSLFISSFVEFWQAQDEAAGFNSNSLRVDTLLYGPSTPGRIFALSENELTDRLHDLHLQTDGALQLSETAGILQIFKNSDKYDAQKLVLSWTAQ